jgi:hypothetical protein
MAEDNFFNKDWSDRSTGGKIAYGALAFNPVVGLPVLLANETRKAIKGSNTEKERLAELNKMIAESEQSPYNVAQVSKENIDYYNKALADYAKARREAEYGFSPEERAAARQTYAETANLARQNALAAGGGTMGKYINANLNAGQGQFATQLAAQDAEIKRAKQQQVLAYLGQLGQASGVSQDVATQNFQKQIMAEQALGQAKSDWYAQRQANQRAVTQALIAGGAQAASMMATGGAGGTGTTTPAVTSTTSSFYQNPNVTPIPSPVNPNWSPTPYVNSDIRLKENIKFSHKENGYNIYEFNYKSDPSSRYTGVMAQEVIEVNPSAVVEEDGYYKVYYDMLGITMKKLN